MRIACAPGTAAPVTAEKGLLMANERYDYCIGTDNHALRRSLTAMLDQASFYSSGESKSIPEFLRVLRRKQPWLAIVDTDLPPGNLKHLAQIIEEDGLCAALYINTGGKTINGYMQLKWPVDSSVLIAVAETLCMEYAQKRKLKRAIKGLEEKLSSRREIDKAKGILMEKMSLNEENAYRHLQKISMESRKSMLEVAEKIISEPDSFYI